MIRKREFLRNFCGKKQQKGFWRGFESYIYLGIESYRRFVHAF